ncbi:MAG: hypothetical protein ACTSV1_02765 [Alphaproteobacteria bacterium]
MLTSTIPLWARLAALIALLISWPVMAAGLPKAPVSVFSPLLTPVALTCTRLFKQQGRDVLINNCGECRIVKVQRKRPGSAAPINRTLTLAPKTTTQLSFRGPGRSRILSDTACKRSSVGKLPPRQGSSLASDGKKCLKLAQSPAGIGLLNACNECRAAIVERVDAKGNRKSQTLVIAATSAMKLPTNGATGVRIQSEKSCPR